MPTTNILLTRVKTINEILGSKRKFSGLLYFLPPRPDLAPSMDPAERLEQWTLNRLVRRLAYESYEALPLGAFHPGWKSNRDGGF